MKFKLILTAILMLVCVGVIRAQNPPPIDSGRGLSYLNGRIGINTNGATSGQVVTYNGTSVVWGAGGGGIGATTLTNITSSGGTVTITGQGSNVLNVEVGSGGGDAFLAGNQTFTGVNTFTGVHTNTATMVLPTVFSFDPAGSRRMFFQNGNVAQDWNQDFGDTSIMWTNGNVAINIGFTSGIIQFNDVNASQRLRIGAVNTWRNAGGSEILNIDDQTLDSSGVTKLQWHAGGINTFGASTNVGTFHSVSNLTVGSGFLMGGVLPANIVTNIVGSGATISGQGTQVLTVTVAGGSGNVATNLSNFYDTGTTQVLSRVSWTRKYEPLPSQITSGATITPDRDLSGVFYCNLTHNPTLAVPTNMRSGEQAKIYLKAMNITNTVTLASQIIIPTSSTLVSPFTIQTNTTTLLTLGYIGTNYVVEGYVPGYNIPPIP